MNSKVMFEPIIPVHISNVKLLGWSNESFRSADFGVKAAP